MSADTDGDTADSVYSEVREEDWTDIRASEFVDFVEGRASVGLVFEHDTIGLHGIKFDKASGRLHAVGFEKNE